MRDAASRRPCEAAPICATSRSSPSIPMDARDHDDAVLRRARRRSEELRRLHRHRRHRRRRPLHPPRLGARPRSATPRQLGLFPRPRRADAAGEASPTISARCANSKSAPCLAVRMVFDKHGEKRRHTFLRAMMQSAAKLSYQEAQAAIDGNPSEKCQPLMETALKPLWAAYQARREGARQARPARPRSARTQNRPQCRRQGRSRRDAPAPRSASPDRRVHDPGERRRRRDARGKAPAARLPRPRRAEPGEAAKACEIFSKRST